MTMILVDHASKLWPARRGKPRGVSDISFVANPGEIIGVVGPNGAGKSTLLRVLAGVARLSSGTMAIDGHAVGTRLARRAVGYTGEPPLLPPDLTGSEWLLYLATLAAPSRPKRLHLVRWAIELVEGQSFMERRIRAYSRGMALRLAFAGAVISGSLVLLLDEVMNGIDPIVRRLLAGRVRELGSAGRVILVASHDLAALERLATRVLVLADGELRADVPTAALLDRRVAELIVTGGSGAAVDRLLLRFPDGERTVLGASIPLRRGISVEHVLAACAEERVPVARSRVRFETLEELVVQAASGGGTTWSGS